MAILLLSPFMLFAQQGTVSGTVSDATGGLPSATVVVKGTTIGTSTDLDGNYSLKLDPGTYKLVASYIGFSALETDVTISAGGTASADFTLSIGINLDELIVTGTRTANRTNTDAPVPVDVINVGKLSVAAPQTTLNQLLHTSAPSFSSNTQTISDGTDHIDPAALRGLGPDQVLVLVNGKRRHTSSLVNVNGTFGRGNVGTDLNAIPASAVKTIEVLRDGAAAQYGSDAIAGVINIRMKNEVNKLNVSLTTGANFTDGIGAFEGELRDKDGEVVNLGLNYGLPIGEQGGFINFTGEFEYRGATNRMKEFSGGIFNGLNSVERVARAAGQDVSQLSMEQMQSFSQEVDYFSNDLKGLIQGAPSLDSLQTLLGADFTTEELAARGQTRSDYNMRVGQSQLRGGKFFANMAIPLGENMEVYSFGGIGYRNGSSGCFYRLPSQNRTTTAIYPNGTVPKINSNIHDKSISAGIKGMIGDWNIDLSNTYGSNSFLYYMTDTHNATLGASSPTAFNAGGHSFTQNTANFDVAQYFDNVGSMKGINVAFGTEYRYENYKVIPGTEQSYGNYDVNGNLVTPTTPSSLLTTDLLGRNRPSGSQCFAGFLPTNEVDANRSSVGAYIDTEFDISDAFLVNAAVRFEDYSDFGSTFNYKLAARYKVGDNLAIRGAHSTGFRAPSLHQIHFSRTSTIFELVNGVSVPQERGTFANTSRAAKLLGIPELKQETSQNFSLGFTLKAPDAGLRLTVDAYQVNIQDRVILTGAFSAGGDAELESIFQQAGAGSATFFANAIDTKSQGLDIVVSHRMTVGEGSLTNNLAGTFSQTTWNQDIDSGDLNDDDDRVVVNGVKASQLLADKNLVGTYFDQTSRIYLEQAVPRTKLTLSNTLALKAWTFYLRNTYFGQTTEATNEGLFDSDLNQIDDSIDPYYDGKVVTDLSVGYAFSDDLSITVGANNLLDIYPDESDSAFQSSGRFLYTRRSPQFSTSGRHIFGRLVFTLK
ncbi:MAG: TonB-dependent receptor [Chitinophagales bacterium]